MFEENNFNTLPQDEPQLQYPSAITITPDIEFVEKQIERRSIRKAALGVGLPCIGLTVIGILWSYVYLAVTNLLGLSTQEAVNITENPAVQQILQIVLSSFMFLVPFTIAAKAMGQKIGHLILFNKIEKGKFLPFLFFGIGFCSFAQIATNYASAIFESFGIEYNVDFGENPRGIYGFLLSFIATAIVPALVEEFACRGVILGLLRKHGDGFAILTSAIVFGVMHGNFQQIPFATIVGLILGYIYVKTNSIWLCVLVHGLNNAVSVIFSYLDGIVSLNMQNVVYMVYLIASLLIAIFGVYLLSKNKDVGFEIKKVEDKLTEKQKYRRFFTSWIIILFLAFNLVEALAYFVL